MNISQLVGAVMLLLVAGLIFSAVAHAAGWRAFIVFSISGSIASLFIIGIYLLKGAP